MMKKMKSNQLLVDYMILSFVTTFALVCLLYYTYILVEVLSTPTHFSRSGDVIHPRNCENLGLGTRLVASLQATIPVAGIFP